MCEVVVVAQFIQCFGCPSHLACLYLILQLLLRYFGDGVCLRVCEQCVRDRKNMSVGLDVCVFVCVCSVFLVVQ